MRVRIDRLHYPVTALGPGRRLGIWFQGCTLACPGCLSRDTWDPEGAMDTTVSAVLTAATALCPDGPDGVTISGGEPFEQPEALASLVAGIRRWSVTLGRDLDVLAYSGMPLKRLVADHADLVASLDALIPEPYVAAETPSGAWRGSGNQPLLVLSELGTDRFRDVPTEPATMQVAATDGVLWMIGVPRPGDLSRLTDALRARGIGLHDVSWRP